MTTSSPVKVSIANGVAHVAMDDGKANVMSETMTSALNAALDEAQAAQAIVVISGRAGVFSGGFDLGVFKGSDNAAKLRMMVAGARLSRRLLTHPQPVVLVCSGHAMAMGSFLVLSADVRLGASDSPLTVQANEVAIGMTVPYFAIETCRLRLTPSAAHAATTLAQPFNAAQALSAGFFDQLCPADQLVVATQHTVQQLQKLHMPSFAATKARLREPLLPTFDAAIDQDIAAWSAMLGL